MLRLTHSNGTRLVFDQQHFPISVGRAHEADVQINNCLASRYHCELDIINGDVVVRDLSSKHGTYVNGKPIVEKILESSDQLQIGTSTLTVELSMTRSSGA